MAGKSDRIAGITIELGGDTTGLSNALKGTNSQIKSTKDQLKDVERLLKLDPTNTELLAQKQRLLSEQIGGTKDKLSTLKDAEAQVQQQMQEGKASQEQYDALRREIIQTEHGLKDLERQANDTGKEEAGTGDNAEKAGDDIATMGDEADKSGGKLQGLKSAASAVGTGLAAVGAAAAAVGTAAIAAGKKLYGMANDVAEAGDAIDKNSQKIGISAESYQEWGYVFQRCGADVNNLQTGMKKLSGVITDAANGSDSAAQKLSAVGLSIEDLNGKSQDEQLSIVIAALQDMESGADRTAAANDLLGKSATDMAAVLNMTADETEALKQEAQDYGMVMSNDAVAASAAFEDSLTKLQGTMGGLKNRMAGELLPGITMIMDGLSDLAAGNEQAGEEITNGVTAVINTVTKMIPQAVKLIGLIATAILENAPSIIQALAEGIIGAIPTLLPVVMQVIAELVTVLMELLPQIVEAGMQILASLITGIATALPTLIPQIVGIVIQICQTLIDNLPLILDAALQLIMGLAKGLLDALPVLLDALPEIINGIITFILDSIPEIIQAGIDLLTSIVDALPEIIDTIVAVLPEIITGIIDALLASIPELVQAGIDLLTALITDLPTIIATVVAAIPEIIAGIVSAIGDKFGDIVSSGKDLIVQLGKGILEKVEFIKSKVRMLWRNMKAQFEESFEEIVDIGANLVKGLWNGIKDTVEWIKNKISGFVDDVLGWFKDLFGINSPSKETAWFGEMLGAGLANGIADSAAEAVKAAGQMASDVLDAAQIDLPDVSGSVGGNGSYGSIIPNFAAISGATLPSGTGLTPTYQNAQFDAINVYVDGSHVENVEILADLVADRLNEAILSKMAVFA